MCLVSSDYLPGPKTEYSRYKREEGKGITVIPACLRISEQAKRSLTCHAL